MCTTAREAVWARSRQSLVVCGREELSPRECSRMFVLACNSHWSYCRTHAQTVSGGAHTCREGEPCVAVMAAHLPGVRLHPFATDRSSLPSLGGGGSWAEVMRLAARGGGGGGDRGPGGGGRDAGSFDTAGATGEGAAPGRKQYFGAAGGVSPGATSSSTGLWRSSGASDIAPGSHRNAPRQGAADGDTGGSSGDTAVAGPGAGRPLGGQPSTPPRSPHTHTHAQPRKESVATFMLSTPHFVQVRAGGDL